MGLGIQARHGEPPGSVNHVATSVIGGPRAGGYGQPVRMRKPPSRLPLGVRVSSSDSRNRVGTALGVATVVMRVPTSLPWRLFARLWAHCTSSQAIDAAGCGGQGHSTQSLWAALAELVI